MIISLTLKDQFLKNNRFSRFDKIHKCYLRLYKSHIPCI